MLEIKWSHDEAFLIYEQLHKIPQRIAGIYFIYNSKKELLYLGIASDLRKRIIQHFNGGANTEAISDEFKYFSVIYEEDPFLREWFESYLIKTINPPYNKTRNPKSTCKGIKKDGTKCNMYAIKNGYCRHHKNQKIMTIYGTSM